MSSKSVSELSPAYWYSNDSNGCGFSSDKENFQSSHCYIKIEKFSNDFSCFFTVRAYAGKQEDGEESLISLKTSILLEGVSSTCCVSKKENFYKECNDASVSFNTEVNLGLSRIPKELQALIRGYIDPDGVFVDRMFQLMGRVAKLSVEGGVFDKKPKFITERFVGSKTLPYAHNGFSHLKKSQGRNQQFSGSSESLDIKGLYTNIYEAQKKSKELREEKWVENQTASFKSSLSS